MKVFKFGGASVKSADAVKNVASILQRFKGEKIAVIISAIGKTTNALEELIEAYYTKDTKQAQEILKTVKNIHIEICDELFNGDKSKQAYLELDKLFSTLQDKLDIDPSHNYGFEYDQIVSYGELLSTRIVSDYLNDINISNEWYDVRRIVKTDNTYRDAQVDFDGTEQRVQKRLLPILESGKIVITQGFLGGTSENLTTTLGREGSDYSAAIIAYSLKAESMSIWKDVPGVLNADPRWMTDATKLANISYSEAIELTYFGASVIHPKTLKPLQNRSIPLHVKSFIDPTLSGTVINDNKGQDSSVPSFIRKTNQVLISISPKDYSFIVEKNLSDIFGRFAKFGVKINLMQNSALHFHASVENKLRALKELLEDLETRYNVKIAEGLELVTVRHYSQKDIDKVTANKNIIIEERNALNCRMVLANK